MGVARDDVGLDAACREGGGTEESDRAGPHHECPRARRWTGAFDAVHHDRQWLDKSHMGRVMTKLGARNRTHAAVLGIRLGLVE